MDNEEEDIDEEAVESVDAVDTDDDDDDGEEAVEVEAVEIEDEKENEDEDESLVEEDSRTENAEEGDEGTIKSHLTEEDMPSVASGKKKVKTPNTTGKRTPRRSPGGSAKKARTPSVAGLTIPFRTVKKAMKLDPDIPIVQNEAAIMTTVAAEMFLKKLADESFKNAKRHGRNTIRYEDVAEARTHHSSLSFLETLLP